MRFADLMEHYFNSNRDIRLVVQLVDIRHDPSKDDLNMISFLKESGYDFIVVMTKSDKLNKTQLAEQTERIKSIVGNFGQDIPVVAVSAVKGDGIDEVKTIIESKLQNK